MRKVTDKWDWIAHPDGGTDDDCKYLINNRDKIDVIYEWDRSESYEYDLDALVVLDGQLYMLTTSGCSCPSPTETWYIDFGPATYEEMAEWMRKSDVADCLPVLDAWARGDET